VSRASAGTRIDFISRVPRTPLDRREAARIVRGAATRLGAPEGRVAVLFTTDEEIRSLNRHFRGKDRPTDVLSFPDGRSDEDGTLMVGDVIISIPAARRNALRERHSLRRETIQLLIHGLMHLLGYDHEVDGGEMESIQKTLMLELGNGRRGARA
jgi:probable rRNA maturation factor